MDQWLLQVINQEWTHPVLDVLMVAVTVGAIPGAPLLGWGLLRGRHARVGRTLLFALIVSLALTLIFYYLALRPRPTDVRLLLPMPPFPSYPSGHAAAAFATATVLALAFRRRWLTLGAIAGALVISYSRLYLGHHFLSDLFGGAILGAATGAAIYGLRHAGDEWVTRLQWFLWLQIALALVVTQMAYLDLNPKALLAWPFSDKVLHALLFGAITFWLNLWLQDRRLYYRGWALPLAILLPFTIALLEEGLQAFSPLRTADITDLLADLTGMLIFWWISYHLLKRRSVTAPL
jgi:undecaprenyl-diphosphatase